MKSVQTSSVLIPIDVLGDFSGALFIAAAD
jgi:hypothetical protein